MPTRVIRDLPHPFLEKICQYKEEFAGREVVTDYPKDISWSAYGRHVPTKDSIAEEMYRASYWAKISQEEYVSKYQYLMPRRSYLPEPASPLPLKFGDNARSFTEVDALYPKVGTYLERYLAQEPWDVGHPWASVLFRGVSPGTAMFLNVMVSASATTKLTVTPLYHLQLEKYIGRVTLLKCSMLKCSVFNPNTPEAMPSFAWIRPEWLEEHTNAESYEDDFKKQVREITESVLKNIQSRTGQTGKR